MIRQSIRGTIAVSLLGALPLTSCTSAGLCRSEPTDVAEIHVAVQSVAAFDSYVDSLQPKFTLTSEAAFEKAIPVTQLLALERLRALAASLRVALPVSSRTKEEVTKTEDGAQKTSSTETVFQGPGKTKDLDAAPQPGLTGATPYTEPAGTTPDINIFLRYRAAAALLQEVSLLSSYVKDAAVTRGTSPFVVRLLVTVLPHRRDTPYDAYTTVAFSPSIKEKDSWPLSLDQIYQEIPDGEKLVMDQLVKGLRAAVKDPEVEAVPLFVTDSVDSAVRSSADVSDRGVDLSLGGMFGGVGASVGAGAKARDSKKSLGRPVSGAQTIGRSGTNGIVVRLGADAYDDTYSLPARTYSVTALVLVPVATRWVGALDGWIEGLGPAGRAREAQALGLSVDVHGVCRALNQPNEQHVAEAARVPIEDVPRVLRILQLNLASLAVPSQVEAVKAAHTVMGTTRGALNCSARFQEDWEFETVRNQTAAVRGAFDAVRDETLRGPFQIRIRGMASKLVPFPVIGYTATSSLRSVKDGAATVLMGEPGEPYKFTLPSTRLRLFGPREFAGVFAWDDGKATELTVGGAVGLVRSATASAMLCRDEGNPCAAADSVRSVDAKVSEDGRSVGFQFPSLVKFASFHADSRLRAEVEYRPNLPSWSDSDTTTYQVVGSGIRLVSKQDEKTPAAEPKVTLRVPSAVILVGKEGHGELSVEVRTKNPVEVPEVRVVVTGADLLSVDGGKKIEPDFVAATNQRLTLHFGNLFAGSVVSIEAQTKAGANASGAPARVIVMGAAD